MSGSTFPCVTSSAIIEPSHSSAEKQGLWRATMSLRHPAFHNTVLKEIQVWTSSYIIAVIADEDGLGLLWDWFNFNHGSWQLPLLLLPGLHHSAGVDKPAVLKFSYALHWKCWYSMLWWYSVKTKGLGCPATLTYLVWCSTLNKVKHRDSNYFLGLTAFNQVPGQNCNESLLSSDRITMELFIMWEQQSLSKLILRYSAPRCFGHTSYWYWLQYYSSRCKIICLLQYRSLS
jgi:hypothetical protein